MKRVILDQPHTHAGRDYQPGDSLPVKNPDIRKFSEEWAAALDVDSAQWLISRGVAHNPDATPDPAGALKVAK